MGNSWLYFSEVINVSVQTYRIVQDQTSKVLAKCCSALCTFEIIITKDLSYHRPRVIITQKWMAYVSYPLIYWKIPMMLYNTLIDRTFMLLSHEHCKLIGWYWMIIVWRQLYIFACPIGSRDLYLTFIAVFNTLLLRLVGRVSWPV